MSFGRKDNNESVAEIRARMKSVRGNLEQHVAGLVDHSQKLFDWKHYVRSHPWAGLLAAAAVGYFAIPKKRAATNGHAPAEQNGKPAEEHSAELPRHSSAAKTIASFTGNVLFRAGLAYLGQQAGKMLGEHAAAKADHEEPT